MMSIQYFRDLIEQQLDHLIPEKKVPHKNLYLAARYSTIGNGKRLRPLLVLATTKMFGGDIQAALTPACALEMVHTYSLIHDDLPAMDNDNFRRGKLTLHKAYPESHAILAGDFLLTYAFDVISRCSLITNEQKVTLIQILASCSGGEGMIGGQVMDLEAEGQPLSLEALKNIHSYKTASLLKAAFLFGGIIANVSEENLSILEEYGNDIGLAFQIIDDVLDITSSLKKRGTIIGSDFTNNKTTCATLLGVEKAKFLAKQLHESAQTKLNQLNCETSLLRELTSRMIDRTE